MTTTPVTHKAEATTSAAAAEAAAAAPVPRWAVRIAHIIPLLTLPSGLWRVALAVGISAGVTQSAYDALTAGSGAVWYLLGLSVLSEALALLALGLVRPWGVVPPRWLPILGGRRMRPWAVVLTAGTGSAALIALWTPTVLSWWSNSAPRGGMTETGHVVIGLLYVPLIAWGPLLAVLTVAYHRRHARRG